MSVTAQKALHLHPDVNGHHVLFFIYLDLHNQKLCTMQILFLSCQKEFQTQSVGDRLFALSTENMFAVKDKKRRQPLPSDLTLQKTNRVFLPEAIKVQEFRPVSHPSG